MSITGLKPGDILLMNPGTGFKSIHVVWKIEGEFIYILPGVYEFGPKSVKDGWKPVTSFKIYSMVATWIDKIIKLKEVANVAV